MKRLPILLAVCWALTICNFSPGQENAGAEFKVLTRVYSHQSNQPISYNETIFSNDLVYDFQMSGDQSSILETCIYQTRDKQFVLLDYQRKIKLQLDELQLIRIFAGMKSEIESQPELKSIFMDDFSEKFDADKSQITVANPYITYTAKGARPQSDLTLNRYLQFLDQFTMACATIPHALPPFARIRLNQQISKVGLVPERISLNIKPNRIRPNGLIASTTHELVDSLTPADRDRIRLAKLNWTSFRAVELAEFRNIERIASKSPEDKVVK